MSPDEYLAQLNENRKTDLPKFGCVRCGICCTNVQPVLDFNEPINADGSCSRLTTDGLCSIYETRPMACRVDEFDYTTLGMTREQWYAGNYDACEQLITIGKGK